MKRFLLAVITAGLIMTEATSAAEETEIRILEFSELDGWEKDNHAEALAVFLNTCSDMKSPDWKGLCRAAEDQTNAKAFFELFFRPVQITDGKPALFTGYFEPELEGDLYRSERFRFPNL